MSSGFRMCRGSPRRDSRTGLLEVNSEYSAEFIRHARLARLNVGPSNEHLGRC